MANEGKKKIYLTDEEKYDLIRLWEGEDVLYDVTNMDYHNNNKRNAALQRINDEIDVDISVSQLKDTMKSFSPILFFSTLIFFFDNEATNIIAALTATTMSSSPILSKKNTISSSTFC